MMRSVAISVIDNTVFRSITDHESPGRQGAHGAGRARLAPVPQPPACALWHAAAQYVWPSVYAARGRHRANPEVHLLVAISALHFDVERTPSKVVDDVSSGIERRCAHDRVKQTCKKLVQPPRQGPARC